MDLQYQLLKRTLNFEVAVRWLARDSQDDFFPDPLNFRDIEAHAVEYLQRREHRLLQCDTFGHLVDYVPKGNLMLREAIWLHPVHRVLYLAVLHHFLARLDRALHPGVYSYRWDRDEDTSSYPFPAKMDRWKHFHNDFRAAALDSAAGAILITDLASYFNHISCEALCHRIRGLLGSSIAKEDEAVIDLLAHLLSIWSSTGNGIPQNLDASSFFGNIYLHSVDKEMELREYKYFRWLDDIRVVASSRSTALKALHDLQGALARHNLFLASDKTRIVARDDPGFAPLVDVKDDEYLSRLEELVRSGDCQQMAQELARVAARLEHHSTDAGDERKFRAFANRLREMAEYEPLLGEVSRLFRQFVLPRLATHPGRTDYWAKMLGSCWGDDLLPEVQRWVDDSETMFSWQRFQVWRLLVSSCVSPGPGLVEKALSVAERATSVPECSAAIVFAGKHGSNDVRELLFARHFTAQKAYPVQRAVLIAIQELPTAQRESYFERALAMRSEHRELIEYLRSSQGTAYGELQVRRRPCRTEPVAIETKVLRGVGLVDGEIHRFRLLGGDYDYE